MTIAQTVAPTPRKPLRVWPGVVLVIVQWLLWFVLPVIAPEALMISAIGGLGAGPAAGRGGRGIHGTSVLQ